MKQLLAAATLSGLLISGCTGGPAEHSDPPTASSLMVPDVSTAIRSEVVLEDPDLVIKKDEQLPLAPDSFAVDGNQIIMDDYLEVSFAIYQKNRRIIAFPEPTPAVDFVVRNNQYYVLSTESTVGVYARTGKGLKEVREIKLPEPSADDIDYDRLYFEGPNLIAQAGNRVLVEGPGPLRDEPQFNDLKHAIHFTDGNINATVPLKYTQNSGARRIALNDKHAYYLISDWKDDNPISVFRQFILQFTLDGQLVHTYAVQPGNEGATTMEFLVADDKLYQMWISNKTVKVFLLEPNNN